MSYLITLTIFRCLQESDIVDSESILDAALPTSASAEENITETTIVEETPEVEHVIVEETTEAEIAAPVKEVSLVTSEVTDIIAHLALYQVLTCLDPQEDALIGIPAAEETLSSDPVAVETAVEAEPEVGSSASVTLGESTEVIEYVDISWFHISDCAFFPIGNRGSKKISSGFRNHICCRRRRDCRYRTRRIYNIISGNQISKSRSAVCNFVLMCLYPQESAPVDLDMTASVIPATEEISSVEPVIIEDTVVVEPEEEIYVPLAVNSSAEVGVILFLSYHYPLFFSNLGTRFCPGRIFQDGGNPSFR